MRRKWCEAMLVAGVLLSMGSTAAAETAVEIPAEGNQITHVQLPVEDLGTRTSSGNPFRRAEPDLVLKLGRPMKRLCWFVRAPDDVKVVLQSAAKPDEKYPKGTASSQCVDDPALTQHVWVGIQNKPTSTGPWQVELGFYDPASALDYFFTFPTAKGDSLRTVYPVMDAQTGLYNMLGSDFPTEALFRRRIFLEAPPSVLRTLAFDVKASDLHPTAAAQFTAFPTKGETVALMESRSGKVTVVSLDGIVYSGPEAAVLPFDASTAKVPTTSRRKPSSATGSMNVYAARALASAGMAPASKWVAAYEAHEACYRKEWDKLDPGGRSHHFILVSSNGATRDLDAVVDQKARQACNSAASEKTRLGLLSQIGAAQGKFFAATSKEVSARLSALR